MPSATQPRERTNLQTVSIEYRTRAALDGVTVAPPISLDPQSPFYVPADPADMIHRYPDVLDTPIGLINLTLLGLPATLTEAQLGDRADRYVKGFLAIAYNTGAGGFLPASSLFIGDNTLSEFSLPPMYVSEIEPIIGGVGAIYRDTCCMIPQGCMIGIVGLPATVNPDGYNIVRIQVLSPHTVWSAPLLEQACCCEQEERPIPPPPG